MWKTTAILLWLAAAPASEYDRVADRTTWVEAHKGMRLLVPFGIELRVQTEGRKTDAVKAVHMRFWSTLGSKTVPLVGLPAADTGSLGSGALFVDGARVDGVSCAVPSAPTPMGSFTTWHRDVSLTAKGARGLAKARKSIEITCGGKTEQVEGEAVKRFAALATNFASSTFTYDVVDQMKRQSEFEKREAEKEKAEQTPAPASAPGAAAAVGGEMAALRARKLIGVADCIANSFEEDSSASAEAVTKKCKGYIDANGNLIGK